MTFDKPKVIIISLVVALVVVVGIGAFFFFRQQQQMSELVEQFNLDKEELADEYNDLSLQYEGYKFSVGNDSLLALLSSEQIKVQRLMEELRTVKSSNARRIGELKKELETLRGVMRHYVAQIDSLNTLNTELKAENQKVKQQYRQASETVSNLKKEKDNLTERVTLAQRLETTNLSVQAINARGKKAKIAKATQLVFNFTVVKNISATTGNKVIYLRIMRPDGDVLVKSAGNTFSFEGKGIQYSVKRAIEYTGEELPVTVYWDIEEFLSAGTYRVYLFADGNKIGERTFNLE